MSDKPSPKAFSSTFMNAALAVLVGSIALYLSVELIIRIAAPLAISCLIALTVWLVWTWRRRPPSSW